MSTELDVDMTKIKRLKGPKQEFVALTSSLDQKFSLRGSLRAAGLTALNNTNGYYIFGSLEGTTIKHYCTGADNHPGLEVIKCRLFDLSRLEFLGINGSDEAIEQDIIATFHIETRDEVYTDAPTFSYNINRFITSITNKTDSVLGALLYNYIQQLHKADFIVTAVDYRPDDYAAIILVNENVKVVINYFIYDHVNNIQNYHRE